MIHPHPERLDTAEAIAHSIVGDVARLEELAAKAMDMVRWVHQHAQIMMQSDQENFDPEAANAAFGRAGRCLRLTIALKQRILQQARAEVRGEGKALQTAELRARAEERRGTVAELAAYSVGRKGGLQSEALLERVVERLEREDEMGLITTGLETLVRRACARIGVAAEREDFLAALDEDEIELDDEADDSAPDVNARGRFEPADAASAPPAAGASARVPP